jgi:hypothetical protein
MYTIKTRKDSEIVTISTDATLVAVMVQNKLIQGAPPKRSWAFSSPIGPLPILEFYISPLPEGFPIEAGEK